VAGAAVVVGATVVVAGAAVVVGATVVVAGAAVVVGATETSVFPHAPATKAKAKKIDR